MNNYDHTVETHDHTHGTFDVRMADVGWEYRSQHHDWRKANNREQAMEFAKQDLVTKGGCHEWRSRGQSAPAEQTVWTPPSSKTPRSFFGLLKDYLRQVR